MAKLAIDWCRGADLKGSGSITEISDRLVPIFDDWGDGRQGKGCVLAAKDLLARKGNCYPAAAVPWPPPQSQC